MCCHAALIPLPSNRADCVWKLLRMGTFRVTSGAEGGLGMCEDVIYVTKENYPGQLLLCIGK